MHRTITGILRKIREIEASSMGVETLRGYNLLGPLVATQKPGITNNRQFSSNSPMRFLATLEYVLYFWQRGNHGHWKF
jgi:hypothetical protein